MFAIGCKRLGFIYREICKKFTLEQIDTRQRIFFCAFLFILILCVDIRGVIWKTPEDYVQEPREYFFKNFSRINATDSREVIFIPLTWSG